MLVLLIAFSLFHLFASAAALGHGVRLLTPEERAEWRSRLLLAIAVVLSWTYPMAAALGVLTAWDHFQTGQHDAVPIILAPLAWLLLMGALFAVVDFAEDGVLGNAKRRDAG